MKGADSGYVDTMLQFGFVGMAALAAVLVASVRDFVKVFRRPSVPLVAYWYAGIILVTFLGSFTEILFLVPGFIFTFIFVAAAAGLRLLGYENESFS
jgi:O-antigen ligase